MKKMSKETMGRLARRYGMSAALTAVAGVLAAVVWLAPGSGEKEALPESTKPPAQQQYVQAETPEPLPTAESAVETAAQPPLTGQVIGSFDMTMPVYNESLAHWAVHCGVDIAAGEGTQVCAALPGKVTACYRDDLLGHCVTVTGEDGMSVTYACLQGAAAVREGQQVMPGDPIGAAGTSADGELWLGSHLHLEMRDGKGTPVDPALYIPGLKE